MSEKITDEVQLNIATWVSREPYEPLANIEKKIKERLKRKFRLRIDSKILEEKIKNYKDIYCVAKKSLPEYILPSKSGYAEPRYIKSEEIKEYLSKIFPMEDKRILDAIINWVFEYEYLR